MGRRAARDDLTTRVDGYDRQSSGLRGREASVTKEKRLPWPMAAGVEVRSGVQRDAAVSVSER